MSIDWWSSFCEGEGEVRRLVFDDDIESQKSQNPTIYTINRIVSQNNNYKKIKIKRTMFFFFFFFFFFWAQKNKEQWNDSILNCLKVWKMLAFLVVDWFSTSLSALRWLWRANLFSTLNLAPTPLPVFQLCQMLQWDASGTALCLWPTNKLPDKVDEVVRGPVDQAISISR